MGNHICPFGLRSGVLTSTRVCRLLQSSSSPLATSRYFARPKPEIMSTGMQFFKMKFSFAHPRSGRTLLLLILVLVFHSRRAAVNKVMEYDNTFTGIGALFTYLFVVHFIKARILLSFNKELNVRYKAVSCYL